VHSSRDVLASLVDLKARQVTWLPHPALLGFLATTSSRDSFPAVGVARLERLLPGDTPTDVAVHLRGRLPRLPLCGESVAVSISRYDRFTGFQIKSGAVRGMDELGEIFEQAGDSLVVRGRRTYTTHHGPYELQFFERVPFEEMLGTIGNVDHGVLATGLDANISPRLVFHHELQGQVLTTYHGDGVAMKTYRNLSVNPRAAMLLFDFPMLAGWTLFGRCEEVPREENPRATEEIDRGFRALGFGRPNRIFRHRTERVEPLGIASDGP